MLRFRRDRLYLGVEPDRLTLVRLSGESSNRVVTSAMLPFEGGANESTLVEALRQELRAPQWQKAESHIVLADRLVRYFVAERPPGARNIEEVQLAAGLRFEDIFGVPADEWEIRLDMPALATNQLGCAIRKSFIADLATACADAKSPAVSISPFAVTEFNRSHARGGSKDGWFTVLGNRTLWVGRKQGRDWLNVHQHALGDDVSAEFSRLMAQEYLRAALPAQTTTPTVCLSGLLGDPATREQLASNPAILLGAPDWIGETVQWSKEFRFALSPAWPACA